MVNGDLSGFDKKLQLGDGWTFQQASDPKRASKSTQKCLTGNRIESLAGDSCFGLEIRDRM